MWHWGEILCNRCLLTSSSPEPSYITQVLLSTCLSILRFVPGNRVVKVVSLPLNLPVRLINGSSGELKKKNPDPYISPFNKNNTKVSCLSPKETDAFRFIYLFNDGKQQKLLGCCLPSCQCRPGIICCLRDPLLPITSAPLSSIFIAKSLLGGDAHKSTPPLQRQGNLCK